MKSTKILITSLIFLLMVGTVSVISLYSQTDKVIVSEEVLFGDANNVSNLSLNMKTTMENFHIWDIKTPIGSAENSSVDYKLHSERQYISNENLEYFYLTFAKNFSSSTHDIFTFNEENMSIFERNFKRPDLAIIDVASRAEPNSKYTEIITLKDYYEFYPFGFKFFIEIKSDENDEIISDFSNTSIIKIENYFKFPVRDDKLEISVTKNDLGVNKIECISVGIETNVLTYSVVLDDKIFLAIEVEEIDNHEVTRIVSTEIYQLDIFTKDGYIEIGDITKIKTFDDEISIEDFIKYDDFLVTLETKDLKTDFVVYSKENFEEIQRLSISDMGFRFENLVNAIYIYHSNNNFTILTEKNGIFSINYEGELEEVLDYDLNAIPLRRNMFFIDNQLIILTQYEPFGGFMQDIIMTIYDENGIKFISKYSLSQKEDVDEYSNLSIFFEDFYVEAN